MEPEIVIAAVVALIGAGLPEAAARFLRRQRLTRHGSAETESPHVSAKASFAEVAEIARDDHVEQITIVQQNEAVGTLRLEDGQRVGQEAQTRTRSRRFDITFADIAYGIAMLAGIAAKAVWDYENKYHKVGVNWLQVNLALLVAPVVYVGVNNALQSSAKEPVSLSRLALAFQNGFFWQTVFSTLNEANGAGGHG